MGEGEGEEASVPPSFFPPSVLKRKSPNKWSEQRHLWVCELGRRPGQLARDAGLLLRGAESSRGLWLQGPCQKCPASPEHVEVAWGPPRELRGCRGLSPDSGTSGSSRPTSPVVPQLQVGSRKQPKLGEARTRSSPMAPVSVPGTALPAPQAAALRVILDCSLLSTSTSTSTSTYTSTSRPSANPGGSSFKIFPEPAFALSSLAPRWACPLLSPIWRVAAVPWPSSCSLSPTQSQRDPADTCVGSHPSLLRALVWLHLRGRTSCHQGPRGPP